MNCWGNTPEFVRVTKRLRDDNGNPVGIAHKHLILDTWANELEYHNGYTIAVSANIFAEKLFH